MTGQVVQVVADVAIAPGLLLAALGVWVVGDWRKAGWCITLAGNVCMAACGWANLWVDGVHSVAEFAAWTSGLWQQIGLRTVGVLSIAVFPPFAGAAQVRHLWRYRHEPWSRLTPAAKTPPSVQPVAVQPVVARPVPVVASYRARSLPSPRQRHYEVASHRQP